MPNRQQTIAWGAILQLSLVVALLAMAGHLWQPTPPSDDNPFRGIQHVAPTPPFEFPHGGRKLFPQNRLVALYGVPGAPVLGALGQQNVTASVQRVKKLARAYQPYMTEQAYPTFEIIATVASASPTANNDYSAEVDTAVLARWINVAKANGIYVILDLQPGRTDFLTQAKQLKPLLLEPNVGLALDPEWRLTPTQVPLKQIGAVSIREVNQVGNWLAELTRANKLPQKIFLLHQFRNDMLPERDLLNTSHPELAYAIQMDGQGTQSQKRDTWRAITHPAPDNVHFGWKNFYQKDVTLLSPADTMLIRPKPWYVSYQ